MVLDARSQPVRILLVDDDPGVTEHVGAFLERTGYAVGYAADGRAALERLEREPVDLVILDVLMPVLDGREVLRRLRRAGNWTPVILLTRVGSPTERAVALDEGADDYLGKPFEPYELVARIRRDPPARASRDALAGRRAPSACRQPRARPAGPTRDVERPGSRADRESGVRPRIPHAAPRRGHFRERLLDAVWGWDYPAATRAVDTRIAELRRGLKDDAETPRFIETSIGQGYRFVAAVEVGR